MYIEWVVPILLQILSGLAEQVFVFLTFLFFFLNQFLTEFFLEFRDIGVDVIGFDVSLVYYDYSVGRWFRIPEDIFPIVDDGTIWNSIREKYPNEPEDILGVAKQIAHTDGMPQAVDLTLYVVDQDVREDPRMIRTRVALPRLHETP